jgi:elongator complex protein 3
MMTAMDAVALLLDDIAQTPDADRNTLRRVKRRIASRTGVALLRNDALLARYRADVAAGRRLRNERLETLLRLNAIRSESGVATVTVITEPFPCPGRCVYCPTEARAPKSYLPNEPAVLRALRSDFDPAAQVRCRLAALAETGHATDKVELIVKGGTWSFYPAAYQERFIQQCVQAANDWGRPSAAGTAEPSAAATLEATLTENESARARIIGITIETRPDYVDAAEILRLRRLGVTRVELGVQTLEEDVLAAIVRDHGTAQVREATRLLKDAGFKVAYHLMPNLPGATPASDLASLRGLFDDPAYRPDALKIYPCVVLETAELYQWWRQGRHRPYDDETLIELLLAMKRSVPPYVRLERIIRDIPSTSIRAGSLATNLREAVQRRMAARGLRCRCIRCRQVRAGAAGPLRLVRRTYEASGGTEVFLSAEDPGRDQLASLLRLRIPRAGAPEALPELRGAALLRELHTYGTHLPLHAADEAAAQHRGWGARLVREAERIACEEFGRTRLAVIAGVGVRAYYRRLGYALEGTYMVKPLGSGANRNPAAFAAGPEDADGVS